VSRYEKRFVVVTTGRGVEILKLAGVDCQSLEIPPEHPRPMSVKAYSEIDALGLPKPFVNALVAAGIVLVSDLTQRTASELLKEPNIGPTKVQAMRVALSERGLALKGEKP
jgi:DNA-directed RNA polymerase alpha subunit